jgi:hypothetical protein
MKAKHIPVLLFILVFAGVFLLGHTSARADWARDCSGTLPGVCLKGSTYTLKAFIGFKPGSKDEIPVDPGVNWPICDPDHNRVIFRYINGVNTSTTAAESYVTFNEPSIPLGSIPTGAQLNQTQLFNDCSVTEDPARVYWKLNPNVTPKKDAILEIYYPLGTGVDTNGQGFIKTSADCTAGQLCVAQEFGTGNIPQGDKVFTNCSGYKVTVSFNQCGQPTVKCNNQAAVLGTAPRICVSEDPDTDDCAAGPNVGPWPNGALMCSDPPVFAYGYSMWFCE